RIPNVGKSNFINALAGKACTKTGNKPGVTKGKQWIRLNKNLELLDTPGILWPKFEDQKVGERLAMIGSIKDELLHADELAVALLSYLQKEYPQTLKERYQINIEEDAYKALESICISRKCFQKGEQPDILRASGMVLEDFRSGRIGKITLEHPEEWQ
ncbi:MAG: 50S ribosome-binding GTPase, partial [Lachnospiraceae bacterium]|nr:50S ribosome-binding GTPase [Lachnospiraceae bacterium]